MAVVISPDSLRSLASDTSYERGMRYANDGRVGTVSQHGDIVRATVTGREPYGVRLVLDGHSLAGHCTCPMGAEGEFCKHCIALAIVWSTRGPEHRIEVAAEPELDDVEAAALTLARDDLVDLVVGHSEHNPAIAAELLARAGMLPEPDGSAVEAMRARIAAVLSEARTRNGDVYYEVEALVEELACFVRSACSDEVVPLVEEAANRWAFIEVVEHEVPEIKELETWLDEILQEARNLVAVRKPVTD